MPFVKVRHVGGQDSGRRPVVTPTILFVEARSLTQPINGVGRRAAELSELKSFAPTSNSSHLKTCRCHSVELDAKVQGRPLTFGRPSSFPSLRASASTAWRSAGLGSGGAPQEARG